MYDPLPATFFTLFTDGLRLALPEFLIPSPFLTRAVCTRACVVLYMRVQKKE